MKVKRVQISAGEKTLDLEKKRDDNSNHMYTNQHLAETWPQSHMQ